MSPLDVLRRAMDEPPRTRRERREYEREMLRAIRDTGLDPALAALVRGSVSGRAYLYGKEER